MDLHFVCQTVDPLSLLSQSYTTKGVVSNNIVGYTINFIKKSVIFIDSLAVLSKENIVPHGWLHTQQYSDLIDILMNTTSYNQSLNKICVFQISYTLQHAIIYCTRGFTWPRFKSGLTKVETHETPKQKPIKKCDIIIYPHQFDQNNHDEMSVSTQIRSLTFI